MAESEALESGVKWNGGERQSSNPSHGHDRRNGLQVPGQLCSSHSARCRRFTGVSAHLRWLVMSSLLWNLTPATTVLV